MTDKIAIIGAGYTGLSLALSILNKKPEAEIVILEAAPFIGGQVSTIPIAGTLLERGYHHLFTNDKAIQHQVAETLGKPNLIQWYKSSVSTLINGKTYPTNGPLDLLKLSVMPFHQRILAGINTLQISSIRDWEKLEKYTACEYLQTKFSDQVYKATFEPLLKAKFGDAYNKIGMAWMWSKFQTRLKSRKLFKGEMLGYPNGSFQVILDLLQQKIEKANGKIILNSKVLAIGQNNGKLEVSFRIDGEIKKMNMNKVVATVPNFEFVKLAKWEDNYSQKLKNTEYFGAIVVILQLKNKLTNYYWTSIADGSFPFLGIIEQTNLLPISKYNNTHIVYLTNYVGKGSPLFKLSPEQLLELYSKYICKINQNFSKDWILDYRYNYVSSAQPIQGKNYSQVLMPHTTPMNNLYLANTSQIYPHDRGTNYSVILANTVFDCMQQY